MRTQRPLASSEAPRPGDILAGRYRLDEPIAEGGMGRVYRATQLQLGRTIAVKLLTDHGEERAPEFAERFSREAAMLASMTHPNIVTIHDHGRTDAGDLFLVMEYVKGSTLSDVLEREGPMPYRRILSIAIQVARALREAHRLGIIHRDLKPANLMVGPPSEDEVYGLVKVLDFGLAKLYQSEEQTGVDVTRVPVLLGSPKYMSPEQICCEELDPRADIYSLGAVLYHACAGRPPFLGLTATELIQQHIKADPPPIAETGYQRACPPQVEALIRRCLEKSKEARFPGTNELIREIKDAYRGLGALPLHMLHGSGDMPKVTDDHGSHALFDSSLTPIDERDLAEMARMREAEPAVPLASGVLTAIPGGLRPTSSAPAGRGPDEHSTGPRMAAVRLHTPTGYAHISPPSRVSEPQVPFAPPLGASARARQAIIGTVAAVLVLATVLFGSRFLGSSDTPPAVLAAAPPVSTDVAVRFESTPVGARVAEKGVALGVTPFIRTYPRGDAESWRPFTFELEGHRSVTVQTTMDRATIVVQALLEKAPEAEPAVLAPGPAEAQRRTRRGADRRLTALPAPPTSPKGTDPEKALVPRLGAKESEVPLLEDDGESVPAMTARPSDVVPRLEDDPSPTPMMGSDVPELSSSSQVERLE